VAQQYLPQALQGKVFYQPGDQGYERAIHDQVARRREAQLAAMVEDDGRPLEILTFRPGERAHDRWLQRAVGNAGERLGHLRDRVLDAARIQRHHVVLDLNAGTGLLTWESLRRAPEGGTWALARDRQAGEGLRQQAERLPELERPVVLVGEVAELPALLALRGEGALRFDAVVGRNALGRLTGKAEELQRLAGWLRPGGCLSLAETMARHAQRLYGLVDLSRLGGDLGQRVRGAEEAIYANADDPLVNWEAADLERLLVQAGVDGVVVETEAQAGDLLGSAAVLDRWFALDAEADRPSYAQHLLRGNRITPEELAAVRAEFQRQLAGQAIPWRTETAFIFGRHP
jgi:putative ATPase